MLILFVLCVSSFAQELNINTQSKEDPYARFEHYTRMKKWGTGLIVAGSALTVHGAAVAVVAQDACGISMIGGIMAAAGYYHLAVGVPLYVCGRIRATRYKRMLPASVYVIPNGAQLVWSF